MFCISDQLLSDPRISVSQTTDPFLSNPPISSPQISSQTISSPPLSSPTISSQRISIPPQIFDPPLPSDLSLADTLTRSSAMCSDPTPDVRLCGYLNKYKVGSRCGGAGALALPKNLQASLVCVCGDGTCTLPLLPHGQ